MLEIRQLLDVADRFARITGLEEKTVSYRVFTDSKKLTALKTGADLTTARFNGALQWFSDNWPQDGDWPEHVERPAQKVEPS